MMTPSQGKPPPPSDWSAIRVVSCIRFDEVCVLQGAPLIGAMFSIGTLTLASGLVLVAVVLGSLALVAHVFVLNDWSGIHGDLRDPARAARTFIANGVTRSEAGWLSMALLLVALSLYWFAGWVPFFIAVVIAGTSAFYSAPAFHMKGRAVFGSALHLVGGALHFLLGYAAFSAIDQRGLLLGSFFALVFAAGHLTHEARGYEGDLLNGIRTNAVVFGRTPSFVAGLVLFTAAYALLAVLAVFGIVPRALLLAAILCPLHVVLSLRALRAGLTQESLGRLQRGYRLLYAIIGAAMVVTTHPSMT